MEQWYCAVRGQQPSGPFSLATLRGMIAAGEVKSSDVAWKAGTPDWLPVARIPEIAAAPPERGAPPPFAGAPPVRPALPSEDPEPKRGGAKGGSKSFDKPLDDEIPF